MSFVFPRELVLSLPQVKVKTVSTITIALHVQDDAYHFCAMDDMLTILKIGSEETLPWVMVSLEALATRFPKAKVYVTGSIGTLLRYFPEFRVKPCPPVDIKQLDTSRLSFMAGDTPSLRHLQFDLLSIRKPVRDRKRVKQGVPGQVVALMMAVGVVE